VTERFQIRDTPLPGLKVIDRKVVADDRGFLERLYCADELGDVLANRAIVQINRTLTSRRGTVRGLHFQVPPHAEIKIVSCLRGKVFDVAVDLRQNSSTFLKWHAEVLSDREHRMFLIPEGFAHGFQTLSDDCELLYFHSALYEPGSEGGVNPRDPTVGIRWPEEIAELSLRDAAHPILANDYHGVAL
jgi:dTDP-4-dehydrorhamnose 3,5-epimerase